MSNFSIISIAMCCLVLGKVERVNSAQFLGFEVPPECEGRTLCDVEPANYPYDLMEKHVENLRANSNMVRSTPEQEYELEDGEPEIVGGDDENNCVSVTKLRSPFSAQHNSSSKLVLQTKYFKQTVLETRCEQTRAPCFQSLRGMGYTSTCEEKFTEIQLYLYDPIADAVTHESVPIPVCCRCVTQKTYR